MFCDASEKAYDSVAYLRIVNERGHVYVFFVMASSRMAERQQITIPCLELCAALTEAQLTRLLQTILDLSLHLLVMWTDSTTVLTWLQSESCRYKQDHCCSLAHRNLGAHWWLKWENKTTLFPRWRIFLSLTYGGSNQLSGSQAWTDSI